MNHTNKRPFFIIIFAIVLALALAACGGGEEAPPVAASPTEPAAPPAKPTTPPEAAPDVRPDIPLLADAANLTAAEAGGEYSVSYSSASGLEAAASFYQAQMPPQGWAYDANVSSAAGGVNTILAFQKGEETAAITLAKVGDGVQVIIAVAPRQMEETAGTAEEAAAETAAEPPAEPTAPPAEPTEAPAEVAAGPDGMGMAGDIPIMEGATGVVAAREGADYVVTYQSSAGVDDIVAFYQAEMPLRDWAYDGGASSLLPGVSAELYFTRADGEAGVSIATLGLSTQVAVAISGQAADAAEAAGNGSAGGGNAGGGDAAAQPTTAAAQPPPANSAPGGRSDIPLMDDAVSVEVTTAGGDFTTTYNSASSVDAVKSFYESQMPAYGWTYKSGDTAYVPGVSATLYYTKNGEDLTVSINIQGGVTRVQIVIN